jgi:hypothetical protein
MTSAEKVVAVLRKLGTADAKLVDTLAKVVEPQIAAVVVSDDPLGEGGSAELVVAAKRLDDAHAFYCRAATVVEARLREAAAAERALSAALDAEQARVRAEDEEYAKGKNAEVRKGLLLRKTAGARRAVSEAAEVTTAWRDAKTVLDLLRERVKMAKELSAQQVTVAGFERGGAGLA